jgi:hypothetical protein
MHVAVVRKIIVIQNSDITEHGNIIMNGKLARIWKEITVSKLLYRH